MKINREGFLRKLESVMPGIAAKETIEQSSCFVFKAGKIITFNDEVSCSIDSDIGIEGAVAAKPLLAILGKLAEEEIDVALKDGGGELLIKGKGRRAGVTLESDINLPVNVVEQPETWVDLPADFTDAVEIVQQCAGKDVNNFLLTCIHITNEYLEACDNYQVARFPVELSLNESCLVRRDSIKNIVGLGMTEASETKSWLHFHNSDGLVFSVRREVSEYEDLGRILDVTGEKISFPGGLSEAVSKAEIFSSENGDNNVVIVKLASGKLSISGVGVNGWYEERREVKWDGGSISFSISPKLLNDISEKSTDCFIGNKRLKVDNGKYQYVTVLGEA
jgi:DNA polymerase III sliding clamp (beta) subunit (PCNA family)